jgi:phosphoribosylaminoimidazole carboxylase
MLAAEASLLNIELVILDVGRDAPAKQVLGNVAHIDGSFTDPIKIKELADRVDILTVEIEHVNVDVLDQIQSSSKVIIHPSPSTIRTIQDKYLQKQHLRAHGCPLSHYIEIPPNKAGVEGAIAALGLPLMLKSRTLAYDGRGNFALKGPSQVDEALAFLANRPLYAEKWVHFEREIAVMVVRSASGQVRSYPAVETVHKDNICHLVFAPLRVADAAIARRAREVAEKAIATLSGAGVFGVEMFLMENGEAHALRKLAVLNLTRRRHFHQRDRPSTTQFRSLHH